MAEGQKDNRLIQTENLVSRSENENGLQLGVQHSDEPPAKTINTTGNKQVGDGNTQVITGSTTNTYITNYNIHIENYHQIGNEPFSLTKSFQLKSGDQLTRSTVASTQTQGSAEGRCSCQSSLESDGIECPKCGHVITTNKRNSTVDAFDLLKTSDSVTFDEVFRLKSIRMKASGNRYRWAEKMSLRMSDSPGRVLLYSKDKADLESITTLKRHSAG